MPSPASPANLTPDTTAASQTTASTTDTKEYTVAPGRTVTTDDEDAGPGGKVTLPLKEGDKLQKLGFFLADDGSVVGQDGGPATVKGAEIREQQ